LRNTYLSISILKIYFLAHRHIYSNLVYIFKTRNPEQDPAHKTSNTRQEEPFDLQLISDDNHLIALIRL
jgi:hypothetical protein